MDTKRRAFPNGERGVLSTIVKNSITQFYSLSTPDKNNLSGSTCGDLSLQELLALIDAPPVFPLPPKEEATAYFRGGFRKWNGKFIDNLPKPMPVEAAPAPVSSNGSKQHERVTEFKNLPPLVGVRCYKSNTELLRASVEQSGGGQRGQCTEISQGQFKRAIRVLTDSDKELNSLLTVTYPDTFPRNGRIFKAHLKRFLERLRETMGEFDYFLAIEYQRRGAPHAHIGLSVDLSELGEVVTLKREPGKRRSDTFQTVEFFNRKAFVLWRDTIAWHNDGVIKYNGHSLEWAGIAADDHQKMERAFAEYNSGVSWELMREDDGAKRYFVKELTGKKGNRKGWYQKSVPEGFENPGRHFLNSYGFVNRDYVEFAVDYDTLCWIVERSKLEYLPDKNRPIYKWLWNSSVRIATHLVRMGYSAVSGNIKFMRKYWDLRRSAFEVDLVGPMSLGSLVLYDSYLRAVRYWDERKRSISRKLAYEREWEHLFSISLP